MTNPQLSKAIKKEARRLGFDFCRILPVDKAPHADFFETWIKLGSAADMAYLEKNLEKRRDPALLAKLDREEFSSIIALAVNYYQFELPEELRLDSSRGIIASYAWGDDYHEIIRPLLYELDKFIRSKSGRASEGKCLVDTGPVLERDWAQRAGIGFTGKNCCTINPIVGSWLFLATIMVPEELDYDELQPVESLVINSEDVSKGLEPSIDFGTWQIPTGPFDNSIDGIHVGTCGRCTRCIDACPTDAFVGPFYLESRRCISYWTIETQNPIPRNLRSLFGNRIFGCDICQEVCPWNKRLGVREPLMDSLRAYQNRIAPPLLEGFHESNPYWLKQDAFSLHFRKSPVKRAKRNGMLRNVCVALGNWGDPLTITPLLIVIKDPDPIVRGHAAWALGEVLRKRRIEKVYKALASQQSVESDDFVREEIYLALNS